MPINPAPRRRAGDAYINQSNFNIAVRCEKGRDLAPNLTSTTFRAADARRSGLLLPTQKRRHEASAALYAIPLWRESVAANNPPTGFAEAPAPPASAPKQRAWTETARPPG